MSTRALLMLCLFVSLARPTRADASDESDRAVALLAAETHESVSLPSLPEPLASFGAAVEGEWPYVYGGHVGRKHEHSTSNQVGTFRRLNLREGRTWESLGGGPGLQSVALVAHDGSLFRVGGMQARNAPGEPELLFSTDEFARYDADSGTWEALPRLPEKRSSHDAAVLEGRLYVVGGWMLAGDPKQAVWLRTVWSFDLAERRGNWKRHADSPFFRRALCVAAAGGRLVALGGMNEHAQRAGEAFRYEPEADRWIAAPSLPTDGFGMSAIGKGEFVFATGESGAVLALAANGEAWEVVARLEEGRMFPRLVAYGEGLLALGGANSRGHVRSIERVELSGSDRDAERAAAAARP